jgi:N-acetylneuraminate synthase/N,N'-diacetyllegionaminate synthase
MKTIQISGKSIGVGQPVFIIAEAGVNHNGKIELAKKLVDIAVDAGADAVKFQTFKSEDVVTKNAKMAKYQEKNLGKSETQLEMIKKFELPYEKFIDIKNYCDNKRMIFLSTPHSDDAVDFLDSLVPVYKIGSGDLTNLPFLEKTAKKGKPVIISTGMSILDEVIEAVNAVKKTGNNQIILLHCTTSYPCKISDVNLRAMETMKKTFEDVLIGYSDHTLGIDVMELAAKHGAVVIEKHFTVDKNLPGPDHKASLDANELKEAVKAIKNKDYKVSIDEETVLGSSEKKPTSEEEEIAKIVRKSIVAKVKITKGKIITKEMLTVKRPGTGIKPKYLNEIIGKRARVELGQDETISREDLI